MSVVTISSRHCFAETKTKHPSEIFMLTLPNIPQSLHGFDAIVAARSVFITSKVVCLHLYLTLKFYFSF